MRRLQNPSKVHPMSAKLSRSCNLTQGDVRHERHPSSQVDFCSGKTAHRTKTQQGTEQVVKAVALPKRRRPLSPASAEDTEGGGGGRGSEGDFPIQLWDLTAGLGTDAFVLARAGWNVRMFERSPVVAALVQARAYPALV